MEVLSVLVSWVTEFGVWLVRPRILGWSFRVWCAKEMLGRELQVLGFRI